MKRNLINANTAAEGSTIAEEDLQIPTRDQTRITLRIYRSKSAPSGRAPILVMYHGGGFCLGGLDNETLNCRRWVERFGGVAINVDYRLAPEHAFPTAVHDAYDALKWVCNAVSPYATRYAYRGLCRSLPTSMIWVETQPKGL
jgi:acetyl esterase/lipase